MKKLITTTLLIALSSFNSFAQSTQWPTFNNRWNANLVHQPEFETANTIETRISISQTDTSANLIILHGLKDHSARYGKLLETFQKNFPKKFSKLNVFAYDQINHGLTGYNENNYTNPSGDVESVSENVKYLKDFIKYTKEVSPNKKTIVLGHSMGGLVVATLLNDPEGRDLVDSVVLSAPALGMDGTLIDKINNVAALTVGSLPFNLPVLPDFLPNRKFFSRNDLSYFDNLKWEKSMVKKLKEDELINSGLHTFKTAKALVNGIKNLYKVKRTHSVPVTIVHNKEDQITSFIGSQKYQKAYGSNVRVKALDNKFHDIAGIAPEELVIEISKVIQ